MTYIPYGEGAYKEKYLDKEAKQFINGWQSAMEEIETYFDNNEWGTDIRTLDKLMNEANEKTKEELLEWMESARKMHVVSLIESLPDERLQEIYKEEGEE